MDEIQITILKWIIESERSSLTKRNVVMRLPLPQNRNVGYVSKRIQCIWESFLPLCMANTCS